MSVYLDVNLAKIKHNAEKLCNMLKQHNVEATLVTKCFCADKQIVDVLEKICCAAFGDSRITNLASMNTKKLKLLLRIAAISEVADTVRYADVSCVSSTQLLPLLDKQATLQGKKHGILLMIDLGDLREGIMFDNSAEIDQFTTQLSKCQSLYLYGVGSNLTCYGGVLPSKQNLDLLVTIANQVEAKIGYKVTVSGGNSSSITLLQQGEVPRQVNNLRIGESYLLGRETAYGNAIDDTYDDCFLLTAEVIEVYNKPSFPIGFTTFNAFGEKVNIQDKGNMNRAILSVGRQDVNIDGLTPIDDNVQIIGGSSDHLIVDLGTSSVSLGDFLQFKLNYGALLAAYTSKYVTKRYK